jgi:2-hydroxychromene-2-carboxylate isomerase
MASLALTAIPEFATVLRRPFVPEDMGELILLADRLAEKSRARMNGTSAFFFDLACPFSYLAAERVERLLGPVEWIPAAGEAVTRRELAAFRARAECRAAELRLPLIWPERFPAPTPIALRAAARAAQLGAGAGFALAAARLAFCGGFDLEDPEVLAEAAAAAGLTLNECLAAAGNQALDTSLRATALSLRGQGVTQLPAVRVGGQLFERERCLSEAAALASDRLSGPRAGAQ